MSTLLAEKLTIAIEGKTLIDAVDLVVRPGDMLAVLGPNGAGKSTLLGALAGLIAPTSGAVTFDGRNISAWKSDELAGARAFLPQSASLEWPLTVERVVALGRAPLGGLWGEARHDTDRAVDAALEAMDALGLKSRVATTLSGGERARVFLARAVVGDPRLLLADEPLAGLDPRHQLDALTRLRGMADAGRSVVIAMHDLDLAARYSSRLILLSNGKVIADGAPRDVLTPELIAAAFEVEARVGADDNGPWVRLLR